MPTESDNLVNANVIRATYEDLFRIPYSKSKKKNNYKSKNPQAS